MAVDVRPPGNLPNVYARLEAARGLLSNPDLDASTRSVVEALMSLASTQHELNKRLWDRYLGSPAPHAFAHMGGDDSVEGRQLPSAITFGAAGAIGDPILGYSPISHIHDSSGITKERLLQLSLWTTGQVVGPGFKRYSPPMPFPGTITGWDVVADQVGSIVVDVWKDTWANFPPTVADTITGTEKPTLSSEQNAQNLALTDWTTDVAVGDVFAFYVDSASTIEKVLVSVRITPSST